MTLPNEYATVEQFYEAQQAERFIKLYRDFFSAISGLSETELKILVYILQAMDFGKICILERWKNQGTLRLQHRNGQPCYDAVCQQKLDGKRV